MSLRQLSVSVRSSLGAIALVGSLLLAGCSGGTGDSSDTSPSPSTSENASADSSVVSSSVGDLTTQYTSEAGHFTISFPGEPTTTTQDTAAAGKNVTVEATQWVEGDNMITLGVAPFPEGTVTEENRQTLLEGSINGAVASAGGTLDGAAQPVTIDGLTGLRATVKDVQGITGTMDVAVVLNGNTQITFITHPSDVFDPFTSTFKLS